jgi:hypothetical protein
MLEHDGKVFETIEGRWWACDFFITGQVQTKVFDTPEEAAEEYCHQKDLFLEVFALMGTSNPGG